MTLVGQFFLQYKIFLILMLLNWFYFVLIFLNCYHTKFRNTDFGNMLPVCNKIYFFKQTCKKLNHVFLLRQKMVKIRLQTFRKLSKILKEKVFLRVVKTKFSKYIQLFKILRK